MAKAGIKFDYDLRANEHVTDKDSCVICNSKLTCRWSDYHGEGVCMVCGAPYQLMAGSDKQIEESSYPYLNIKDEWIPVLKEYWDETKKFCFHGRSFTETTGQKEFTEWAKSSHPELFKKK